MERLISFCRRSFRHCVTVLHVAAVCMSLLRSTAYVVVVGAATGHKPVVMDACEHMLTIGQTSEMPYALHEHGSSLSANTT